MNHVFVDTAGADLTVNLYHKADIIIIIFSLYIAPHIHIKVAMVVANCWFLLGTTGTIHNHQKY